jgi:hypothetical protein
VGAVAEGVTQARRVAALAAVEAADGHVFHVASRRATSAR